MHRITFLTLFLFTLNIFILTSCSHSIKIGSFTETKVDFSTYKTYAWMAPNDTALNTRRDDKVYAGVIQSAANSELKKKGMKIDNQNPDAIFIFDSKIEEQIVYRQSTTPNAWVGYGGYAYGYVGSGFYTGVSTGGYYNSTETHSVLIDEGVLGYTMYDRKTSKLLWRGAATQKVNNHTDFERSIKKATSFIFAKLPLMIK